MYSSRGYADFAAAVQFADLPPDVVDLCKLILLDSLGTAAAASGVIGRSRLITSYAGGALGSGKSALWGTPASSVRWPRPSPMVRWRMH